MIDNVLKKQRLESVELKPKDLIGKITEGVAGLKFGVIESFVKLGLPVHDGDGNLIVFMPTKFDKQGELPGKKYSLNYYDADGKLAGSVGDDFAIRVINPESDLAKASGNEEWFWDLGVDSPKIPNSVIDAIILNKNNKITLETLGKALNGMVGKNSNVDGLSELYNIKLDNNIELSAQKILSIYKKEFLKQGYERALWGQVDNMFRKFNGDFTEDDIVKAFLQTPFIVQDSENKETFENRIFENKNVMGPIADKIGSSLANGIPTEDADQRLLQFKDGFEIKPTTQVKPLAALALINLFMETQGDWGQMVFSQKDLTEQFGWILSPENSAFDGKKIWMLDFLQPNAEAEDESLTQRAKDSRDMVIQLVKLITGTSQISVERKYNDMIKEFYSIVKKIERKRDESSANSFETSFKGDMVVFDIDEEAKDASVTFSVVDFNNNPIENLTLKLIPQFEDIESYMWTPVKDLAIDMTYANGKYSADGLKIFNPNLRFDDEGKVSQDGRYRSLGNFELRVVEGEKEFPIGGFPLFAGNNDLNMPFYYDKNIDYGVSIGAPMAPGVAAPISDEMYESFYIEKDMDLFFPYIETTNNEIVGESILHFNFEKKEFTLSDKNGKLSNAQIVLTIINPDYESASAPRSVDSMIVGTDIKEGAMVSILLSGPQIKRQTIDMYVNYVGESGIGVDFVKIGQGDATGQNEVFQMMKDRFSREDRFIAEFDGKRKNGLFSDLNFDDVDAIVGYKGKKYILMFEDFDSITMRDIDSGEFAIFRFVKEEFKKALDITELSIIGKELLFEDDYIAQKIIFLDDKTFRSTSRDKMFDYADSREHVNGVWSIENGVVILESEYLGRISLVNAKDNDDGEFNLGDKVIFAFTQGGIIEPASPEHKVIYLAQPRDDIDSFSYIKYPEYNYIDGGDVVDTQPGYPVDQGPEYPVDENAPMIEDPFLIGQNLFDALSGRVLYSATTSDDATKILEEIKFNQEVTEISFNVLEGNDENKTLSILLTDDSFNIDNEIIQIIDLQSDFVIIQIIEDGLLNGVEKLFFAIEKAQENYDSILYENHFTNQDGSYMEPIIEKTVVDWYYSSPAEMTAQDVFSLKNFWIDETNNLNGAYQGFTQLPAPSEDINSTFGELWAVSADGIITNELVGGWNLFDMNDNGKFDVINFYDYNQSFIEAYRFENGSLYKTLTDPNEFDQQPPVDQTISQI